MTTPLNTQGTFEHEPPPGSVVGEGLENAIELKEVEGLSQGQIVRRRFFRHRGAIAGLITLVLLVILAYTSIGVGFTPFVASNCSSVGSSISHSLSLNASYDFDHQVIIGSGMPRSSKIWR